jgi:hypothetical protein
MVLLTVVTKKAKQTKHAVSEQYFVLKLRTAEKKIAIAEVLLSTFGIAIVDVNKKKLACTLLVSNTFWSSAKCYCPRCGEIADKCAII